MLKKSAGAWRGLLISRGASSGVKLSARINGLAVLCLGLIDADNSTAGGTAKADPADFVLAG